MRYRTTNFALGRPSAQSQTGLGADRHAIARRLHGYQSVGMAMAPVEAIAIPEFKLSSHGDQNLPVPFPKRRRSRSTLPYQCALRLLVL